MVLQAPRVIEMALIEVRCGKGHYLMSVPTGTPYRAYCHRCQKSEEAKAR